MVEFLADVMAQQGPFDGILAFSQGGIIYRHFYRITQEIDAEKYRDRFVVPKFMISVASPVFPRMKFLYKNQEYPQLDTPYFDFPSVHLHGLKDTYFKTLTCHKLFKESAKPIVISFNEAHKFPRCIEDEGFGQLKQFVKDRFTEKNGEHDGELEFEVNYDKFNFEVRFPPSAPQQ